MLKCCIPYHQEAELPAGLKWREVGGIHSSNGQMRPPPPNKGSSFLIIQSGPPLCGRSGTASNPSSQREKKVLPFILDSSSPPIHPHKTDILNYVLIKVKSRKAPLRRQFARHHCPPFPRIPLQGVILHIFPTIPETPIIVFYVFTMFA